MSHREAMGWIKLSLIVALFVLLGSTWNNELGPSPDIAPTKQDDTHLSSQKQKILEAYDRLPLFFIRNDGQLDDRVKFYERGSGQSIFFTEEGIYISLLKEFVVLKPLGSAKPQVVAEGKLPGRVNYFIGNDPTKWRTDIPTYAKVRYTGLYPGIDLVFYGTQRQLEYDVVVKPGADYKPVTFKLEGAQEVRTTPGGDLEIILRDGGKVVQKKPHVYQERGGHKHEIPGAFEVVKEHDAYLYSFTIGPYNTNYTLVIDPIVLAYSTYLGGNNFDRGYDIAVDSSGYVYITGETYSANFPTQNAYDPTHNGSSDVFITKLGPAGDSLVYSTFLGGSAAEFGTSIAVDPSGSAYVTGKTYSTNFPIYNAYDPTYNGSGDAFVTKLSPAGNSLIYSTYLGGSGDDQGDGIAVDASGNAYITGYTESANFPTQNAYDATYNGGGDAFVTKLSDSSLVYSTFLGGNDYDLGQDIAVDSLGSAYIVGETYSTDFPTTPGAFDTSHNGDDDAFVTKFSPDGSSLVYSTFLGGINEDIGYGIAIDSSGNAYVVGQTYSSNFPTTPGAYDTSYNGNYDVFITKLSSLGNSLVYSTYLGGSGSDKGFGIAIDPVGSAYVTGETYSPNFPIQNAYDPIYNGAGDAFVAKLSSAGASLNYSTFLGGSNYDRSLDIAVDPWGSAYVTGETYSTNFPTTPGAYDTIPNGSADAFIAKLSEPAGTIVITKNTLGGDDTFSYTVTGSGWSDFTITTFGGTGTQTFSNLEPGAKTITEIVPSGWAFTSLECVDPDGGTTVIQQTAYIDLDAFETVTCTYTNTKQGRIIIVKDSVPDDPQDFAFTSNIPGCESFSLDDDAEPSLPNTQVCNGTISPDTYTVTESAVTGFDLTDLVCEDPDNGSTVDLDTRTATIDLDPGETVTCTYTNTKRGTIVINKTAVGGDETFTYTGDLGAFSITTTNGSGSQTFTDVVPGTYAVTEDTPPANWVFTSLVCSDPDGGTTIVEQTATIDLDPGEIVTCTYTNTKQNPLIEAYKQSSLFRDINGNREANPGDILLYTITITNLGNAPATGVTYSDTVDANTDLICSGPDAPTTSQGSIQSCTAGAGGSLQVTVGDITGGSSVTITYKVEIRRGNFTQVTNQGVVRGNNFADEVTDDPATPQENDPTVTPTQGTVGGDPPIWGDIMVFPTPENALGKDLNGDGDTFDTVLRYKKLSTSELVNTGIPVSGLHRSVDIYEDTIVFVLQESVSTTFNVGHLREEGSGPIGIYNIRTSQVRLLGVWGSRPTIFENIISISGKTLRYYDLNADKLIDTGIPAQAQAVWKRKIAFHSQKDRKGPPLICVYDLDTGTVLNTGVAGAWPVIYEHLIAFTTAESWVAQDLNGDGDRLDTIIRIYDLKTQTVFNTAEEGESPAIYGNYIVFSTRGSIRYFDFKSGMAYETGKRGSEPDIYEDIITYYVWENLVGADLSGDGDESDPIVQVHRISAQDRPLPPKAPLQLETRPRELAISQALAVIQKDAIRFEVQGVDIESIAVEIYDLKGQKIFASDFIFGNTLTWSLLTHHGVANGVYLYVIKARGPDGQIVSNRVQKLVVLR